MINRKLRILVACEFSGTVRDAFSRKGWDAWSCDLRPSESDGNHYRGDVRKVLGDGWDLVIGHPPCTYLTNSGVCFLKDNRGNRVEDRWAKMVRGAEFFRTLLNAPAPFVAIENPIMHGYGREIVGVVASQTIQPYHFGHYEQKATCLWLRGLPLLQPTNDVGEEVRRMPPNERQRNRNIPPSRHRARERSRTFKGIAEAMAEQWGSFIEDQMARRAP